MFKAKAGIDIVHVPYKSGAEMVTSLLSNQAQLSFIDISILLPLIKEGKLKPLAVTAGRRHPALPDVPTLTESGVQHVATFWTGVLAPANTSPAIVDALSGALNAGLMTPAVRETLRADRRRDQPDFVGGIQNVYRVRTSKMERCRSLGRSPTGMIRCGSTVCFSAQPHRELACLTLNRRHRIGTPRAPAETPAGGCDTHFHIFGPQNRFPLSPGTAT